VALESEIDMTEPDRSLRRARRGQRGAALVEFALVVPLFVLLVMGTIDFAIVFNDYNSVRQGVREGARQAVVADWDLGGCTTGSSTARVVCLTKERIDLDASRVRVRVQLGSTYEPGNELTVCAMYQLESTTSFFSALLDDRVVTSSISMRIEQVDADAPLTTGGDAALSGQDWSWC
jgi:TadE-like protein